MHEHAHGQNTTMGYLSMRLLDAAIVLVFFSPVVSLASTCQETLEAQGVDPKQCERLVSPAATACAVIAFEHLTPVPTPTEVIEKCSCVQQVEIPVCMTLATDNDHNLDADEFATCLSTATYFADEATVRDLEQALTTFQGVIGPEDVRRHLQFKRDFETMLLKYKGGIVTSLAVFIGIPLLTVSMGRGLTDLGTLGYGAWFATIGGLMLMTKLEDRLNTRYRDFRTAGAEIKQFEAILIEVLERMIAKDPELSARLGNITQMKFKLLAGETGLAFFKQVEFQQGRTKHILRPEFEANHGTILALYRDGFFQDQRIGTIHR